MGAKRKAMTVRLPEDLYRAGVQIAKGRHISMSGLLQESLRETLRREQQWRLYGAFGELGDAADETEVEFALPAQAEVIADGER
jgi:predicted transcriptional regulator